MGQTTGDFARDVALVIQREGGATVSDVPGDPGGVTKYGIAQRYHPGVDVRALTLAQAEAIYRAGYWTPLGADALGEPLAMVAVDAAVNAGVGWARRWLAAAPLVLPPTVEALLWARVGFYADLVWRHPEKQKFLAGWIRRCVQVREQAAAR